MATLDPDSADRRRRFISWSIRWFGVPLSAILAVRSALREVGNGAPLAELLREMAIYGAIFIPLGILSGWLWGRLLWSAGFGRRLPGDSP